MTKTLVEQYVENPDQMRLFQQERAIYEVAMLVEDTMKEMNVTRSQLAERLGKSRGWVTQLLNGNANKTIRTVADTFAVLGREFHSTQRAIRVGNAVFSAEPSGHWIGGEARRRVEQEDRHILKREFQSSTRTCQFAVGQ